MREREVSARIRKLGGIAVRQTGSHLRFDVTYVDGDGALRTAHTTVPRHGSRDLKTGTLSGIQKDLQGAFGEGWLL